MYEEEFNSLEDFVFNASFREWLLENNSLHKTYWENWMREHPEKVQLLNYAKGIVYALTVKHRQLSEKDIDWEIESILNRSNILSISEESSKMTNILRKSKTHIYKKLAVAIAVIGISVFSINYLATKSNEPDQVMETGFYKLPSSEGSPSIIDQVNNSDSIQLVSLVDGSKVQLYPKSRLSFSDRSFGIKREVFLMGEAFFTIEKNPSFPFVVYTQSVTVKVLGTSFHVKAYPFEKKAVVRVNMGKVSVYRKENFIDTIAMANKLDGLILIPNQQVTYDVASRQLRKTIIDEPVLLTNNRTDFVFNSTPIKEVFKILQNAYGIAIIYDESIINSCPLSASLGNEGFYEKLALICKAINSSYESIDGTIFISSPGCN